MKVEDQLIFLNQKQRLTMAAISTMVGCSERTLNNIKNTGSGRSKTLQQIDQVYQHYFSKAEGSEIQIREQSRPYGILSTAEVETWAEDTGLTVEEFTRKCLDRYGPMLFKDLKHAHERRNLKRAQPSPDEPAGDVAQRMIDQKEND